MPEYGKKTVAELQEILKGRSLPHTGKKADLVARLNEADQTAESTAEAPQTAPAEKTSDSKSATTEPPAASVTSPPTSAKSATSGKSAKTTKTATTTSDPSTTEPTSAVPATMQEQREDSVATDTKLADAANYKLGLNQSSVDDEAKKREARAKKFGIQPEEEDSEAAKTAARAKKFGTEADSNGLVARLDSALPEQRRGKRGREGEATAGTDDPGLRPGRGGKRRDRGGGRREGKPSGVVKAAAKVSNAFSKDKDRLAAEARKKRFATA